MRVVISFFLLTIFGALGGCARKPDVTYVDLPPTAPAVLATEGAIRLAATDSELQTRGGLGTETESGWNTRVASDVVERTNVQFDLIQTKAERVGVEHLTQADIEGLSFNQIQELRGY